MAKLHVDFPLQSCFQMVNLSKLNKLPLSWTEGDGAINAWNLLRWLSKSSCMLARPDCHLLKIFLLTSFWERQGLDKSQFHETDPHFNTTAFHRIFLTRSLSRRQRQYEWAWRKVSCSGNTDAWVKRNSWRQIEFVVSAVHLTRYILQSKTCGPISQQRAALQDSRFCDKPGGIGSEHKLIFDNQNTRSTNASTSSEFFTKLAWFAQSLGIVFSKPGVNSHYSAVASENECRHKSLVLKSDLNLFVSEAKICCLEARGRQPLFCNGIRSLAAIPKSLHLLKTEGRHISESIQTLHSIGDTQWPAHFDDGKIQEGVTCSSCSSVTFNSQLCSWVFLFSGLC